MLASVLQWNLRVADDQESGLSCSLQLLVACSIPLVPSLSSVVATAGPEVHLHPTTLSWNSAHHPAGKPISLDTLPSQKASPVCSN